MKKLAVILGLTVLHLAATVALIVISLGMTLERFDAGTGSPTVQERAVTVLTEATTFPVFRLWDFLPAPRVGILEFPLLFLNSLLWSTVVYLAVLAVIRQAFAERSV